MSPFSIRPTKIRWLLYRHKGERRGSRGEKRTFPQWRKACVPWETRAFVLFSSSGARINERMTRALTFPDCDANPCAFGLLITLFYDILKWQPCSATKGHWTRKFGSRGKMGLIWPRHMYQISASMDKNSLLVLKKALCTHFRLLKRREWQRTLRLVITGIII